ncbi:MAG: ammonia-forming cytochrome c nitrite reductase subunit c552 [Anaeromyxobacter sp.]
MAAENSMGFHAPQELARVLAESIDLSRQAQVKAALRTGPVAAAAPAVVPAAQKR